MIFDPGSAKLPRMAEIVDASAFESIRARTGYPWDIWLDGQARKLTQGVDFTCGVGSFRSAAARQAMNRGLSYRTQISGNTVLFQVLRP